MKSTPKWLLIPPVVAALLVLGPLSMGGNAQPQDTDAPPDAAAPATERTPARAKGELPGSLVPRTPDMWSMSSALVGVLLLGGGVLLVVKKLRGGATPTGGGPLVTLRQTVRLAPKHAMHAVEFDGRILLVGETDKGLTLIERGQLPDAVDDEAAVLARDRADDDDDGAVPRNLVIPRPEQAPRRAPSRPRSPSPAEATANKADQAIARLNDFRSLLEKAGR